ncbi:MAG: Transposase IS200-family protein [Candidatus Nomurabacteria bacterium GW2011_GWA2_40_9]|uniref:Transposase IS200-family protein n=1 Tax=Candidatus Nomurabacteria bacterium GW2011_GWA2_40_9 TaxID=1618734 RepID=A0A0G0W561_9BACT|nr:MAG: Transposase IS200-family protein [Candidatus Nomurabacteria bacterium GW2011_GWA2_40_9]
MNNRDFKEFAPENIYHIYNRGNNKEKIFFDEQDYRAFLFRLGLCLGFTEKELNKEELTSMPFSRIRINVINKNNFRIHAFCLMQNHFHLLIEQLGDIPISNLILKLCTSYARYINLKYKRVGHIFQDKFKAVLIENDPQFMWTSAYIHMNPVKDGLIKDPSEYPWSSYNDFANNRDSQIIHKDLLIGIFGDKESFIKETLNFDVKE